MPNIHFECPKCSQTIDAPQALALQLIDCSNCKETIEVPARSTPSQIQKPPVIPTAPQDPPWIDSETSRMRICTTSGLCAEITEVQLYDERELKEISVEKARAAELLGGAHSPFGFIGGAFWVVSNMIAQNYILQKLSGKMAKDGLALVERIAKREQKLRNTQTFIHVGRIENIDYPSPGLWRTGLPGLAFGYIHTGDDFVTIKDVGGDVYSLRWSSVERYTYFK